MNLEGPTASLLNQVPWMEQVPRVVRRTEDTDQICDRTVKKNSGWFFSSNPNGVGTMRLFSEIEFA